MKADILQLIEENGVSDDAGSITLKERQLKHLVDDLYGLFQKSKETPKDEKMEADVDEIIEYMNETWGTKFKSKTESHRGVIRGRLRDGHSVKDVKNVILHMFDRWGNDAKMSIYLRPITVFAPSKFEGYLNDVPKVKRFLTVRTFDGQTKIIDRAQYERAEPGYYTII